MVFPVPLEGLHLPRHLLRKTSVNAPYRHAACKSALIRSSFMSYDLQSEGQHDWTPRKSSLGTRAMLMLCWRWGFGFWSLICVRASQRFGIPENVGAWRDVGVLIGINCFTASFSFSWVSARENPNGPQEFISKLQVSTTSGNRRIQWRISNIKSIPWQSGLEYLISAVENINSTLRWWIPNK